MSPVFIAVFSTACATVPAPLPEPPVVTWEDKLGWMMRLEDQRILRDPNPPPPFILAPATRDRPAMVAPPPPSDLIRLLDDDEARVRRRAVLALGRVGLPEAMEPLTQRLADDEPEVSQMAAFALGLIGDGAARPALLAALKHASPLVQGRAAEALGMLGDRADARAVSEMVRVHVRAGALAGIGSDDLTSLLSLPAEAVRLGLYALVRLGSYEALAAAALDDSGRPVSTWWPVAYALQRLGDLRAAPALLDLLETPGRYTAAFAARGLGIMQAPAAAAPLRQIVDQRRGPRAVVIQAVRALAAIGDPQAAPVLAGIVSDRNADANLRVEALTALGTAVPFESLDLLLDLLSDPAPALRAGAMRALASLDPNAFLTTLSGLNPDRDWSVRAAQADSLGTLPQGRGVPRLMVMLNDRDPRVMPAVLAALVASNAPGIGPTLLDQLEAEDFATRAAAANGLANLKLTSAAPALIKAYRGATRDSSYTARAAILAALAELDPDGARPLLEEALEDRDWALGLRAAELLGSEGASESAAQSIRPATGSRLIDEGEWQSLVSPRFSPHAFIETDRGIVEIELAIADAPLTVGSFMALARQGFFNGVAIHRVVPDFVVQGGDPRGDGEGGPGYTIRDEINQRPYLRGTVGMALDWEDTGGSQFFITHSPQPHLDVRYTVFGHVVNGMDVVDSIEQWDVIRQVRIWDGVTESR